MPIYEYKCVKCNKQFEIMQKMSDAPMTVCSSCGGELKKLITNTSFVLKGSGWYVTDYPSADRKRAIDSKKSKSSKKDTKTEKKADDAAKVVKDE
ncbi:MAG: FmdB family zinc ribbon protein [Nitrospirota bacterium]